MSFILDALKKADRERDLARVPTLTTMHIPVLMAGRKIGPWVAAGLLLSAGGLSIWLWRPSASPVSPTGTDSRAQATPTLPVNPVVTVPVPAAAPRRATEAQPPGPAAPGTTRPAATEQQGITRQPESEPALTRHPVQASPSQSAGPDLLAARAGSVRGGGSRPGVGRQFDPPPSSPPQTDLSLPQPAPALQPPPVVPQTVPPAATPVPVAPAPESAQPPAPPQPVPGPQVRRPPAAVAPPPPPATPAAPLTFIDAVARMKMDLFVYTDVPADRMIIVNGHRYLEGDQIDGRYLVESITRDGAVLSYQGEKAVLRP